MPPHHLSPSVCHRVQAVGSGEARHHAGWAGSLLSCSLPLLCGCLPRAVLLPLPIPVGSPGMLSCSRAEQGIFPPHCRHRCGAERDFRGGAEVSGVMDVSLHVHVEWSMGGFGMNCSENVCLDSVFSDWGHC